MVTTTNNELKCARLFTKICLDFKKAGGAGLRVYTESENGPSSRNFDHYIPSRSSLYLDLVNSHINSIRYTQLRSLNKDELRQVQLAAILHHAFPDNFTDPLDLILKVAAQEPMQGHTYLPIGTQPELGEIAFNSQKKSIHTCLTAIRLLDEVDMAPRLRTRLVDLYNQLIGRT